MPVQTTSALIGPHARTTQTSMSTAEPKRPQEAPSSEHEPSTKRFRPDAQPQLKRARSTSPPGQKQAGRPPILQLQPQQRLELFRKKQRWRMSSLYAARNSVASARSPRLAIMPPPSANRAPRYAEIAVQTDYVPELESKALMTKAQAREEAAKKVAGVFSGQLVYDLDEIEDKNKSPVKFPPKKSDPAETGSSSLNALMGSKKLIQFEKPDISEASTSSAIPAEKDVPLGPSSGFSFMKKPMPLVSEPTEEAQEDEPAPKKKFSFGGAPAAKETSIPSFGLSKTDDKPVTKPSSFSFGSAENKPESKPAFSFGDKKADDKPSLFGEKKDTEAAKPAFSFGSSTDKPSTPAFSFGSKPEDKKDETTKPASTGFSFGSTSTPAFGAKKTDDKPSSSLGFSFGAKTDDKTEEKKDDESPAKKPFAFGSSTSDSSSATTKPFTFGTSTETKPSLFGSSTEKKDDKPSFAFASTVEKKEDKPAFSFGSSTSTEKKDDKPSAFTFGFTTEKKEDKPSFAFGSTPAVTTTAAPSTIFGAAIEKKDDKPSFAFGSTASSTDKPTSTFNFGAPAAAPSSVFGVPSTTTTTTAAPSLFGAAASSDENSKKRTAFGSTTDNKPSFNFGAGTSTPTTEKSGFNLAASKPEGMSSFPGFGASATDSKPSFNFGASSQAQNPASVFRQNATSTPSFGGFGQTSTPNPTSAFGQAPSASAFNFGASSTPVPAPSQAPSGFGGFAAPKPPALNGGNMNINFASGTANPASVFGGSAPAPGGMFGTPAPGFGAGTPAGTPNTVSRVPGRKIAQMRSRRPR